MKKQVLFNIAVAVVAVFIIVGFGAFFVIPGAPLDAASGFAWAESETSGVYTDGDVSYTWEITDGAAAITEISCDEDTYEVNFPNEINGCPVTSIPWDYFYQSSNLPEKQQNKITAVTFPDGITDIPWYAMKYMSKLESVSVSENNPGLTVSDGVLFNKDMTMLLCYPACRQGQKYDIPESVTSLKENAFSTTQYLEEVTLSGGIKQMNYAFSSCDSIRCVNLNMLSFIGGTEFSYCPNIEKVTVSENNTAIFEYDNVLYFHSDMFGYSKDGTTLLYYPPNQSRPDDAYTVPESVNGKRVTSILGKAFAFCNLKELVIPGNIVEVNNQSFIHSASLTTLIISDGVEELGANQVLGCTALKYMYVPGSVTDMDYCTSGGPEDIYIYGKPGSAAETYVSNGDMGCFFRNIEEEKIPQDITLNDQNVTAKIEKLEDGTLQYSADLADGDGELRIDFGASARKGVTYSCDNAVIDQNGVVTVSEKCTANVRIKAVVAEGDEYYFAPTEMNIRMRIDDSAIPTPAAQKITGNSKFTKNFGSAAFSLGQKAKTNLKYKSSNSKIAAVSSAGKVTLCAPGKAVITVTAAGNDNYKAATKKITVVCSLRTPTIKCRTGGKKVRVSWSKTPKAKGYQVYVKYPGAKKFRKVLTTSAKVKAVSHKKLSKGRKYTYKIRAFTKVGGKTYYSKFSKAVKVKVK